MTRSELITRLSAQFQQLTSNDVTESVAKILDMITRKLSQGDRIELRGFGSFSVNVRPPPWGRNPRTGESVSVPAKPVPHFKPGLKMRTRVR